MMFVEREQDRYSECLRKLADRSKVATLLYLVHDLMPRLEYRGEERPNYDLFRSAAARLHYSSPAGALLQFAAGVLGLGEVVQRINILADRLNAYGKAMYHYQEVAARWDGYFQRASEQMKLTPFWTPDGEAGQLYASLRTWDDEKLQTFEGHLDDYVSRRLEILILAPVDLFLSLSSESLTLMVRRLLWPPFSDGKPCTDVEQTVLALRDLVLDAWNSGVLGEVATILKQANANYLQDFHQEEWSRRSVLLKEEDRRRYLHQIEKE